MSTNLGIPQLTEGQASPEVTVNDITAALDAVVTETFVADVTAGNVVLTDAQFRLMARISITGAGTAGRTVTVPAIKRGFIVSAASTDTDDVALVRGSTSISISPGEARMCFTDGTTNGLISFAIGSTFDVAVFLPGLMVDGQLALRYRVTRPFTLPINLTGSKADSDLATTGTVTITLKKNGVSIGTINWSAAATVATFTFAAAVSFAIGDLLSIHGPATADVTMSDTAINLKANR